MQHGRVTSALAARVLAGRSRVMSVLMALCLFAAGALAIPGFAARADNNDGPLPIPNTTFVINLDNASEFEAEYGKTGYWGVILDNGRVTPTAPLTFERSGETVTVTADGLWKVNALNNYRMVVPVPNGANNAERVTWEPGSTHWVTVGDLPGRQETGEDNQLLGEGLRAVQPVCDGRTHGCTHRRSCTSAHG